MGKLMDEFAMRLGSTKKCKISWGFCETHRRPSYLCGLEYGTAPVDLKDVSLQHRFKKIIENGKKYENQKRNS